jgi:hypothetical protein
VVLRFVICVALALCACKDSKVAKLGKIRDELCACKTSRCGEEVLDRVPKKEVEPSPRAQQIAREMLNCLAALYDKERPTQDPDAEVSGPESSAPASAKTP